MKRTSLIAAAALVPTLLLAVGWLLSSLRAHDLSMRDREARLARDIETVRAAVDENLRVLREQENARPFYHYNHYYVPPEVLAMNDPVAVSPLASAPSDPRIVGYFQIEPGAIVRTPYSPGGSGGSARERRVVEAVRAPEFARERRQAGRVPAWFEQRRTGAEPAIMETPEGALTTNLRAWSNAVAQDIQEAQEGSAPARRRMRRRGRAAPITNRQDVAGDPLTWPQKQAEGWKQPYQSAGSTNRARLQDSNASGAPLAPRREADVVYGPMEWVFPADQITLQRVVTHEGVPVVQGVLFSREALEAWLPELIERHASVGDQASLVAAGETRTCSARGPVSEVLAYEVCFANGALARLSESFRRDLFLQLGMLGGLLVIVVLALVAILRASRHAEKLAEQQSAFVSAVSHELRTPLTTLRMHAEMLEEGLVSEARRPQVHGDLVHESVRLARLVENVLEASRLENGQRPLRLVRGDLRAHVEDVVEGQRRYLEAQGADVQLALPDEAFADFDGQAVEQILVNLMDNAAKYGARPGERAELVVRLAQEGAAVILAVLDRGPGIPSALHDTVFERFYRVESETAAATPGTGIGLSLVRDLASALGGEAEVLMREGGGTEVRVSFPTSLIR